MLFLGLSSLPGQRDTLEMVGEPVSGMARCPYDPRHANVALFAGSPSLRCLFVGHLCPRVYLCK